MLSLHFLTEQGPLLSLFDQHFLLFPKNYEQAVLSPIKEGHSAVESIQPLPEYTHLIIYFEQAESEFKVLSASVQSFSVQTLPFQIQGLPLPVLLLHILIVVYEVQELSKHYPAHEHPFVPVQVIYLFVNKQVVEAIQPLPVVKQFY